MPISGRRRNKVKGVQFTIMVVGSYLFLHLSSIAYLAAYCRQSSIVSYITHSRLAEAPQTLTEFLCLQVHQALDVPLS